MKADVLFPIAICVAIVSLLVMGARDHQQTNHAKNACRTMEGDYLKSMEGKHYCIVNNQIMELKDAETNR